MAELALLVAQGCRARLCSHGSWHMVAGRRGHGSVLAVLGQPGPESSHERLSPGHDLRCCLGQQRAAGGSGSTGACLLPKRPGLAEPR